MNINTLQKGLIAHYPLDGEHQAKDVTPYGNHGTNYGATLSTGVKGEANGSYSFDVLDDVIYTRVENLPSGSESRTISAWFYPTSYNKITIGGIFGYPYNTYSGGVNHWFEIKYSGAADKKFGFHLYNTHYLSTHTFEPNNWYNLVATYDGVNLQLYINDVLEINKAIVLSTAVNPSGYNFNIGDAVNVIDAKRSGSLSDVRVYNRALSADEIKLLYDSFKPKISTSDLNKGLVGHWMLDDKTGASDLSGSGNDGTGAGGVTIGGATDRKGLANGATDFDGSNDYISVGNDVSLNMGTGNFSISLWAKFGSSTIPHQRLFGKKAVAAACVGYSIYYGGNTGKLMWSTADGSSGNEYWTYNTFATNTWHHIVMVRNNEDARKGYFIINGVREDISTIPRMLNVSNSDLATIGAIRSLLFNGSISDVRVYNRALSAEEISLLYSQYKPKGSANVGSLNKGLVLDMPLTTKHMKSSTVVSDLTPNGNDGTIYGATVGSDSTEFDGIDDYVNCGNSSDLMFTTNMSLFTWFKTSSSEEQTIINKYGFNNNKREWAVQIYSNKIRVLLSQNGLYNSTNTKEYLTRTSYSDGNYHLCGFTWGNGVLKIYVDGIEQNVSKNLDGNITTIFNSDVNLEIGRYSGINNLYHFDGDISGVKIYNRALSADEVALLYQKGRY